VKTYAIVAAEPEPVPGDDEQKPGSPYTMFILLGGMFLVFYLLLIRPQQKKQKQAERRKQEMLDNLARNDQVMTIGGIIGFVVSVGDDDITLRIDDKTDARMRVTRDAISKVVRDDDEAAEAQEPK